MPLPTFISATHAPIWTAMIAWFTQAGAVFGCTRATTVSELKRAFLAADKAVSSEIYSAIREVEYMLRRMMVAAALALRVDKPNAPPSRARSAANTVPDFAGLPGEDDPGRDGKKKTPGKQDPFVLYVPPTLLMDQPDAWLPQKLTEGEKLMDADAEDFARRFLSLSRLLANPDAMIRRLAQRFHADRRRALNDILDWDDDTQEDCTASATWPEHFQTARDLFNDAVNTFDIFAEPG